MTLEDMIRTWKGDQFFLLAAVSTNPPPKLQQGEIRYLSAEEVDTILGEHIERMRVVKRAREIHESTERLRGSLR